MRLNKREVTLLAVVLVVFAAVVGAAAYFLLRDNGADAEQLVVQVEQGTLRGRWLVLPDAKNGERFAAFRGIPYARPPLGALRFKAPRPPTPWSDVRDASDDGAVCLQAGTTTPTMGSEDCLYLNVYTPRAPTQSGTLLPVYLFIHGGTFVFGSNDYSVYGPEFLLQQGIVVVTIKYRLSVFGFLNLDTEEVPGNAGIKDQIAALKWVHRNVAQFGGDPARITVGGQSAGAVSAHWLTLLPESRDLLQSAILESGSALHSFGYNEDHFDVALDLGRRLAGRNVTLEEVSKLVTELPAGEVMTASIAMATERMATLATQIPYATTPERRAPTENGEQPLITRPPELYIIDPSIRRKPLFMGMNSREWLANYYSYGYATDPDLMPSRIANLINLIPKNIIPYPDTLSYLNLTEEAAWDDVLASVDKYYFHRNDTECDLKCTFKKYLDDIIIGSDTTRLAELRALANSSTTFVYRFAVRDAYSTTPLLDPQQQPDGACHSDEIGYIWKIQTLQQRLDGDGLAPLTLKRMTNLWGSFIKTGIPSPGEAVDGVLKPAEESTGVCCTGQIMYLDIGTGLTAKEGYLAGPDMPFWMQLYQKVRGNKST